MSESTTSSALAGQLTTFSAQIIQYLREKGISARMIEAICLVAAEAVRQDVASHLPEPLPVPLRELPDAVAAIDGAMTAATTHLAFFLNHDELKACRSIEPADAEVFVSRLLQLGKRNDFSSNPQDGLTMIEAGQVVARRTLRPQQIAYFLQVQASDCFRSVIQDGSST